MRITIERLKAVKACEPQVNLFAEVYPDGVEPTVENLFDAASHGLDPWWTYNLLPDEGPGSKRAYALWCAEQVAYLTNDPRVAECLSVVRRRVEHPESVSDTELVAAGTAAGDVAFAAAASRAARATAWAAAKAADAAAGWTSSNTAWVVWAAADAATITACDAPYNAAAAAKEAQLTCLSQLLLEAE